MAAVSPFDTFLASLDDHIKTFTAPEAAIGPATPKFFARQKILAQPQQPENTASARPSLSPLERALYYEVETRRCQLQRKQKELDFWKAYEQGTLKYSLPSSPTEVSSQIEEKRRRLEELQGEENLKIETSKALDAAASIQKTLSTTDSSLSPKDEKLTTATAEESKQQYSTTRQLLDERDDKSLEFLRVFNEIRAIRAERQQTKAKIRDERHETAKLLQSIKTLKAETAARQLNPPLTEGLEADSSQDVVVTITRLRAKITEARSKLELVKGIIRGLVLESGKDWTKNRETRELMLSLDDENDASDDDFTDDEGEGADDVDAEDADHEHESEDNS